MADEMGRNEDRYAMEMAEEKRRNQPMKAHSRATNETPPDGSPFTEAESRNVDANGSSSALTSAHGQAGLLEDDSYDELEGGLGEHTFHHPALYRAQPTIWLPRDNLGISKEAVRNARARGIDITDQDADINEKGKVDIHRDTVPGLDFSK